jgi:hypothetical protein
MLTIPMRPADAAGPSTPTRALVVGRSEKVLAETVEVLRQRGHVAGATNDFENVLTLFDPTALDLVIFGGMVAPRKKEELRAGLTGANPALTFVQGMAGIPGLIADQVEAAVAPGAPDGGSVDYHRDDRVVKIGLPAGKRALVTGYWGTAFVPPDPESTSEVVFDAWLDAGSHTVALPDHIPTVASFVVVRLGEEIHPFEVGPMPRGTTALDAAPVIPRSAREGG